MLNISYNIQHQLEWNFQTLKFESYTKAIVRVKNQTDLNKELPAANH